MPKKLKNIQYEHFSIGFMYLAQKERQSLQQLLKLTFTSVLQSEVLVFEFLSIDGFPPSTIVLSEVSSLAHEVRNNTMENASLVTKARFTGAQLAEIFCSLRNYIRSEL